MLKNPIEPCDADFKKVVLLKCYDALALAGFTRFRKEGVDWPMEGGFHCWVGLNSGLEKERVGINPFVGVHVVQVEKFWTRLDLGRNAVKYSRGHATYAIHMGELVPHEPVFEFTRHTDIAAEANRLACLYSDIGLSYALSIGTYERLLPLLRERVSMLGAYPERVASCLYLMGRKEEASSFVEGFLQGHCAYFEGFAVPFLRMLDD